MSATYFREVKVYKSSYVPYPSNVEYRENIYAMIVETAESNVRDDRGGLCWHHWLFHFGTYEDLMKRICEASYHFETCSSQWKPNKKTPEGFIHTCRKAILEAVEQDCIGNYPFFSPTKYDSKEFIKKIGEIEGVRLNEHYYGTTAFESNSIKTMYIVDRFIRHCKDYCECYNMTVMEYAKQQSTKGCFSYNVPQIAEIFKDAD